MSAWSDADLFPAEFSRVERRRAEQIRSTHKQLVRSEPPVINIKQRRWCACPTSGIQVPLQKPLVPICSGPPGQQDHGTL